MLPRVGLHISSVVCVVCVVCGNCWWLLGTCKGACSTPGSAPVGYPSSAPMVPLQWEACGRDPDRFASEVMAAGAVQGADHGGVEAGGAAPAAADPELSVLLGQFMGRAMVKCVGQQFAYRIVAGTTGLGKTV